MPKPSDRFTLEVVGSGDLTGMFFTEFRKRFPFAVCFDRTDPSNRSRLNEAKLGMLPNAMPDLRASVPDIATDLIHPQRADITVRFLRTNKIENIAVFCRGSSRTFVFDLTHPRSLSQLVGLVSEILQAVGRAY